MFNTRHSSRCNIKQKYLSIGPSQTKKLGENLAKEIFKNRPKDRAIVVGLEGDLGGGKTTFLQGFAKGLEIKEKILSPTFVILKKFQIPTKNYPPSPRTRLKGWQPSDLKPKTFFHLDCYRIKNSEEILNLGFKEIVSDPQNIVTIEWAEKIKKILPKKTILVKFKFIDKNKRKISITD